MTKTASTAHIPLQAKAKEGKRIYANFDKKIAYKMFGYRINFTKDDNETTI